MNRLLVSVCLIVLLVLASAPTAAAVKHPSLYDIFGDSLVKLAADGGASCTAEATVTFQGNGWMTVELPASKTADGDEIDNSFAISMPRSLGRDFIIQHNDKSLSLGTANDLATGNAVWWFDGKSENQYALTGKTELSYNATTGRLRVVVATANGSFTANVDIAPPCLMEAGIGTSDCPGGQCNCNTRCSACCSAGYHPSCTNCGSNSASCKCIKNAGCAA